MIMITYTPIHEFDTWRSFTTEEIYLKSRLYCNNRPAYNTNNMKKNTHVLCIIFIVCLVMHNILTKWLYIVLHLKQRKIGSVE